MRILLISDLHANFPALEAVAGRFSPADFDLILNGGDSVVYGPFPNETIDWLRSYRVLSILGNTDRQVLSLLEGEPLGKPRKAEKRVMYGWTAAELSAVNRAWLRDQPLFRKVSPGATGGLPASGEIAMYHGSPADPDEFLFADTPRCRFRELAALVSAPLVTVGHSHQQFVIRSGAVEFLNPGSTGRMFDGRISGGCAVITVRSNRFEVALHRVPYSVRAVTERLRRLRLPPIYIDMYERGRKLN